MLFSGKKIACVVNYSNKKYFFDLERHKTIEDLYNLFLTKLNIKLEPYYSFSLYLTSYSNNNQKKTFNNYEIKEKDKPLFNFIEKDKEKDLLFFEFFKIFKCKSCQNTSINNKIYLTKYCLNCNLYLCNACSNNIKHSEHILIDVDFNNVKDSIKLWYINLNADLSNQITSFNKIYSIFGNNSSEVKLSIWKNTIISKLSTFENLVNNLYNKFNSLKNYFKEIEDMLNKTMFNLSKTEKEMEFLNNDKKYFSFDDAEKIIQKFKNNYNEISSVKNKINNMFDVQNILKMNELMTNLSLQFDELCKTALLIINNSPILQNNNYTFKLTNNKFSEEKSNINNLLHHSVDAYSTKNKFKKIYSNATYNDELINEIIFEKTKNEDKNYSEYERILTTPKLNENNNPIKMVSGRKKSSIIGNFPRNGNSDAAIMIYKQNIANTTNNTNKRIELPKIIIKNFNKKNLNQRLLILKNKTIDNCIKDG